MQYGTILEHISIEQIIKILEFDIKTSRGSNGKKLYYTVKNKISGKVPVPFYNA
jgi:hypothetical protein